MPIVGLKVGTEQLCSTCPHIAVRLPSRQRSICSACKDGDNGKQSAPKLGSLVPVLLLIAAGILQDFVLSVNVHCDLDVGCPRCTHVLGGAHLRGLVPSGDHHAFDSLAENLGRTVVAGRSAE